MQEHEGAPLFPACWKQQNGQGKWSVWLPVVPLFLGAGNLFLEVATAMKFLLAAGHDRDLW